MVAAGGVDAARPLTASRTRPLEARRGRRSWSPSAPQPPTRAAGATPRTQPPPAGAGGGREGARHGPLSGVFGEGRRPSGEPWSERGISGARGGVGPGSATTVTSTTQSSSPAFVTLSAPTPRSSARQPNVRHPRGPRCSSTTPTSPSAAAGGAREGARHGPLSGVFREGRRPSGKPWPELGISGARGGVGPGSATTVTSTSQPPNPSLVSPSAPHPHPSGQQPSLPQTRAPGAAPRPQPLPAAAGGAREGARLGPLSGVSTGC